MVSRSTKYTEMVLKKKIYHNLQTQGPTERRFFTRNRRRIIRSLIVGISTLDTLILDPSPEPRI